MRKISVAVTDTEGNVLSRHFGVEYALNAKAKREIPGTLSGKYRLSWVPSTIKVGDKIFILSPFMVELNPYKA